MLYPSLPMLFDLIIPDAKLFPDCFHLFGVMTQ